jgi:hypothetical protein
MRWELNEDNEPDAENRCSDVQSPNLLALWRKDLIVKYIGVYDYVAACRIADDMGGRIDEGAVKLLRACRCRLRLDLAGMEKALADMRDEMHKRALFPKLASDIGNVFEYLLWLEIKLKNEEYADFIRGVTPVTDEIYKMLLSAIGVDLKAYCNVEQYIKDDKTIVRHRFSAEKIGRDPEAAAAFKAEYGGDIGKTDGRDLGSANLGVLLRCKLKDKGDIDRVRHVSGFASDSRNTFAHQISAVTEKWMESKGDEPRKVWEALRCLFLRATKGVKKEYWDSYNAVNREIERILTP